MFMFSSHYVSSTVMKLLELWRRLFTFLLLELRQAADGGGVNNFYHDLIPGEAIKFYYCGKQNNQ